MNADEGKHKLLIFPSLFFPKLTSLPVRNGNQLIKKLLVEDIKKMKKSYMPNSILPMEVSMFIQIVFF